MKRVTCLAGLLLTRTAETAGLRQDFALPVPFAVDSVALDPDDDVLRWTPAFHAAADSARSQPRPGSD